MAREKTLIMIKPDAIHGSGSKQEFEFEFNVWKDYFS